MFFLAKSKAKIIVFKGFSCDANFWLYSRMTYVLAKRCRRRIWLISWNIKITCEMSLKQINCIFFWVRLFQNCTNLSGVIEDVLKYHRFSTNTKTDAKYVTCCLNAVFTKTWFFIKSENSKYFQICEKVTNL